jgi:hypothetical protein
MSEAGEQKNEMLLSWGTGSQPDADQDNTQIAIDYNFYEFKRSPRSGISLGMSYTQLTTNTVTNNSIEAFSLYPQLTLHPQRSSMQNFYFFVRALGPTYLSENTLGNRQQDHHFSFQAQVGVGFRKKIGDSESLLLQVSWKHFSNANLFSKNDGIDIPFVFSLGYVF